MQTDGVAMEVSGGYRVQPQSAMVGAHRLVCSAGDVVCFDTSTWHTASPNHATRDREAIIINYSKLCASAAACVARAHTRLCTIAAGGEAGSSPASFPIPLELLERAEAAGLVSAERRLVLGMPPNDQ
jgi:hypothetical protein